MQNGKIIENKEPKQEKETLPFCILLGLFVLNKMKKCLNPYQRKRIFERDNLTCQYCGKKPVKIKIRKDAKGLRCYSLIDNNRWQVFEIDHKIPLSRGGTSKDDNLITACWECNHKKLALTNEEFLCQDVQ